MSSRHPQKVIKNFNQHFLRDQRSKIGGVVNQQLNQKKPNNIRRESSFFELKDGAICFPRR
jgi:hypothetical protein